MGFSDCSPPPNSSPYNTRTGAFAPSLRSIVPIRSLRTDAGESNSVMTAANSVRVAAAQMTSVNDLFATCSRLVKEAASAGAKLICFPENFAFVGAKDGESLKITERLLLAFVAIEIYGQAFVAENQAFGCHLVVSNKKNLMISA
ncbi:hypothetical protein L484_025499 [Morus notabilis]|uniref:CN hydrolase domain-containing protein n=1 Tax=Morus notabilis TaxID=981085 RepID=W9SDB9_9ROSA|nr:deaminated glutathione amidase [Morus notabilis]EXC01126.1 hypothetical protein L484_025499 [Morus notabilis]